MYLWHEAKEVISATLLLCLVVACAEQATEDHSATTSPETATAAPSVTTNAAINATEGAELRQALNTTDLELTIADEPDPAVPGTHLTYVLTVANRGPNPASSTTLVVSLSDLTVYQSDTGGCRQDAPGTIVCKLGEVVAHASITIAITVRVERASEEIISAASIGNRFGPDADPTDNTATEHTEVRAATDTP